MLGRCSVPAVGRAVAVLQQQHPRAARPDHGTGATLHPQQPQVGGSVGRE